MNELNFNSDNLKNIFQEIGLYNPKGEFYHARQRKHEQIIAYIEHINTALKKLSTKRTIIMIDCGCGKSYLSFVLYEYCKTVLKRNIKIIGIDTNADLINQCQASAKALGFDQMQFVNSTVGDYKIDEPIDIVYSLHACNTATDQTIAQGINSQAKYIFSVSCCQHRNRKLISGHPLTGITRFQPYKERLVDMVGDSMRSLLLEHHGYEANIFEFIAAEYTPKNIMLRAINHSVKKENQEQAMERYQSLVKLFHFAPKLEELI